LGEGAGGGFVAHHFEEFGARADEDEAGLLASAGKVRVFREETVTGVNGVDALFLGDADDALDVEVGGDGAFAVADLVGFIGFVTVDAQAVFLREDGDGAEIQLGARAKDADGDFAAVRGHQFLDRANGGCGGREGREFRGRDGAGGFGRGH
jgi:hypothetical protein